MIARNDKTDIWARLAAPLPPGAVSWRQDGKPTQRDGKYVARFVAYVDAHTVRERLDAVVPGEWDLVLEPLPPFVHATGEVNEDQAVSFKARLTVLGVVRECVGSGPNYKEAATDAFKRAAVRFGIAHELYGMGQNWVQVDGDGRFAKPVEDPGTAYARRHGQTGSRPIAAAYPPRAAAPAAAPVVVEREPGDEPEAPVADAPTALDDLGPCPKCGGKVWDNRLSKRNPKAPDARCRDKSCDGVIWPPKTASNGKATSAKEPVSIGGDGEDF